MPNKSLIFTLMPLTLGVIAFYSFSNEDSATPVASEETHPEDNVAFIESAEVVNTIENNLNQEESESQTSFESLSEETSESVNKISEVFNDSYLKNEQETVATTDVSQISSESGRESSLFPEKRAIIDNVTQQVEQLITEIEANKDDCSFVVENWSHGIQDIQDAMANQYDDSYEEDSEYPLQERLNVIAALQQELNGKLIQYTSRVSPIITACQQGSPQ
ncbi:MAG: hypothetical protein AAGB12_10165 [Pseudomonadota bacterium]